MAKKNHSFPILLHWSKHVPALDVQDPLGLSLRGSARLASRLLYCITSITRRARYFSFIPWCVYDYQQRELGKPYALGLEEAIVLREQCLTLGSVAHHNGEACPGGAVIGSQDAIKWLNKGAEIANFKKMRKFSKNPALSAYYNSIVNLGIFKNRDERPDADEEAEDSEYNFDNLQLSEIGLELAKRYDSAVGNLLSTRQLAAKERTCTLTGLKKFGTRGCLCELSQKESSDRELLQEMFFEISGSKGGSHSVRRQSLLLILELCRQFGSAELVLDESGFAGAVYYGTVAHNKDKFDVTIPDKLGDIAHRWRMFYFHYFMSVGLEGVFSWLITHLNDYGLRGSTIPLLVTQLNESSVRKMLSEVLEVKLQRSFGKLSPATLFSALGLEPESLTVELSMKLDKRIFSMKPFAEDDLENIIRGKKHLYSSTGLALPLILLATSLARYKQWETTKYGMWLASSANNPYVDLIPPVLTTGLSRRFGNWWCHNWEGLAEFILSRYVVQQHQSMSYDKSIVGDRCLLQVDGQRVISTGSYAKIGMGNLRFRSAIQILRDLGLIEIDKSKVNRLTAYGQQFYKREMDREGYINGNKLF